MCDNCKHVEREIGRLKSWLRLQPCYEHPRKEYWAKRYRDNRIEILAAAKERRRPRQRVRVIE